MSEALGAAPRFVVAGEALMDVFPAGATDDGLRLDARVGGSPFNVAVALARMGQPAAFLGALSTDVFGERLLRRLQQEGVDTALVQRHEAPTALSVVTVDRDGAPHYAFHHTGSADGLLEAAPLPASAQVLQLGSYPVAQAPTAARLQSLARLAHTTRLVAWDLNVRLGVQPDRERWRAAVHAMLPCVHLLKLSEEDLDALWPGSAADSLAAQWLAAGVRCVVLTRGAKGARAWTAAAEAGVRAEAVMLVDTVGAGDAFQAALLTWLAEHDQLTSDALAALPPPALRRALAFANRAAALTCGRRGADAPRRHELA